MAKETAPHSPARFAGSLRFSIGAGSRELAILKKSEDRSNNPRPVSAPSCDARRLQGEVENRAYWKRLCWKTKLNNMPPLPCILAPHGKLSHFLRRFDIQRE
ncbi:MAG: hypothetical protein LBB65_00630 [Burkholderiales bacterium]|nr:hypothetical protein [Burkholderiales bacterium]